MARASSSGWSWGYVIVISKFVVLFIDTGIAKSFGVLLPRMIERLDSDYAYIGLICSLPATLMYIVCPLVTLMLQNTKHRPIAMFGGLLCGSCVIACGFIKSTGAAGVALALSGIGLSMTYMPIVLALNDFFGEKFILFNTLAAYGYTAGSMVLPIIVERSLQAYGYEGAFIILGGVALNLIVCGATVRKASRNPDAIDNGFYEDTENKHSDYSARKSEEKKDRPTVREKEKGGDGPKHREMVKIGEESENCDEGIWEERRLIETDDPCNGKNESSQNNPTFLSCGLLNERIFLFSIPIPFCLFYVTYAWMLFLVPHAEHLGIPASNAIYLSTIGGVGGIIGRSLFIILVGKNINAFVLYIVVGTICTGSFLLDFVGSGYPVRATLAFVQGFSLFFEDSIVVSLSKEAVFDERNFDMALAICNFTGGLGAICAGFVTGYLFDVTQSFTKVFIIIGLIHAIIVTHLVIVAILIKRRR